MNTAAPPTAAIDEAAAFHALLATLPPEPAPDPNAPLSWFDPHDLGG